MTLYTLKTYIKTKKNFENCPKDRRLKDEILTQSDIP